MFLRKFQRIALGISSLTLLSLGPIAFADFGFEATDGAFILIDAGSGPESYRLTPSTGTEDPFDNHNFDDDNVTDDPFNYATNPLFLTDFIATTFEDSGDDVVGVTLYWRQYVLGDSPGVFRTNTLTKVADLGGGVEEYRLGEEINLTVPGIGNLDGLILFELYAEVETAGGGTKILEGRDGTDPFAAVYSGWAIPEPQTFGLIGLGALGLRMLVVRRRKQEKADALLAATEHHVP